MREIDMDTAIQDRVLYVQKTPDAGLPNECYADPRALEWERDTLFNDNWVCLGFAKDVPRPGDVHPIEFLGRPLVLVRDRDNHVKVFHNICSHRGVILIDKPGNTRGVIRCPYHSWCYGLDGTLRKTPSVGGPGINSHPDFNPADHGLRQVRTHVWMGIVFINFSNTAAPFEEVHAHLIERWKVFTNAPLVHSQGDSTITLTLNANWKLAVENYAEAYHLPWVHPGLNSYSRLEDHENIVEPGLYSGQITRVYRPLLTDDGTAFPELAGLREQTGDYWDTRGEYVCLYPNVLLGVHKDHFYAIMLQPLAHDKTYERVEIFYFDQAAIAPETAELRAANTKTWRSVFQEDVDVVTRMQQGRRTDAFNGGVLTPVLDMPTKCFHDWTAHALLSDGKKQEDRASRQLATG